MFLQVCVFPEGVGIPACHSVGIPACLAADFWGLVWYPSMPCRGCLLPGGVFLLPGGCLVWGGVPALGGAHSGGVSTTTTGDPSPASRRLLWRTVHILLECILVHCAVASNQTLIYPTMEGAGYRFIAGRCKSQESVKDLHEHVGDSDDSGNWLLLHSQVISHKQTLHSPTVRLSVRRLTNHINVKCSWRLNLINAFSPDKKKFNENTHPVNPYLFSPMSVYVRYNWNHCLMGLNCQMMILSENSWVEWT